MVGGLLGLPAFHPDLKQAIPAMLGRTLQAPRRLDFEALTFHGRQSRAAFHTQGNIPKNYIKVKGHTLACRFESRSHLQARALLSGCHLVPSASICCTQQLPWNAPLPATLQHFHCSHQEQAKGDERELRGHVWTHVNLQEKLHHRADLRMKGQAGPCTCATQLD